MVRQLGRILTRHDSYTEDLYAELNRHIEFVKKRAVEQALQALENAPADDTIPPSVENTMVSL